MFECIDDKEIEHSYHYHIFYNVATRNGFHLKIIGQGQNKLT